MIRFSANISLLFGDLPFPDRIAAARDAGFDAVECQFLYDWPADALAARLRTCGIPMISLNTPIDPDDAAELGRAALPDQEEQFRRDFERALAYADALDVPNIHVMAGTVPPHYQAAARPVYLANLEFAADRAAGAGRTILIEPLNQWDRPGYFLAQSDEAATIIERVARPNLKLLFDVYHVQIAEGDLTRRLERHMSKIGHVQVAGVPDRHEPDGGEVSLAHVLRTLERLGYTGAVGAEYVPRGETAEGLGWLRAAQVAVSNDTGTAR